MRAKSAPAIKPLRVNDLLFINEYLANGRNGTKAYQVAHPKCSYQSARKCASELLAKPHISAAIAAQIEAAGVVTREFINTRLLDAANRARDKGTIDSEIRALSELSELAGFHVHQVKDVSDKPPVDRTALIEQLRQRGLVAVPTN